MRVIRPALFDHLQERFSWKEVELTKFDLSVKTSCPSTENSYDTPDNGSILNIVIPH